MNQQQQQTIDSNHPRIVCIAGPGSGKTMTLIERIKRLIKDGARPLGIVVITYTNNAADEIIERLGGITLGFCGTLHSYILKLLREYGPQVLGLPEKLAVIDDDTRKVILDDIIQELHYTGTKRDLDKALADRAADPTVSMDRATLVAATYHRRLLENGMLDYDGILGYGMRLLKTWRQSEATVVPIVDDKWGVIDKQAIKTMPIIAQYLLVDEGQDMSAIDAQIYALLPVVHRFIVADYDQAIFAFRGGNPKHVLELAKNPEWEVHCLDVNYRCDYELAGPANNLIAHNTNRIEKHIVPVSTCGGEVTVRSFVDDAAELRAIDRDLAGVYDGRAILCRTNKEVDRIADELKAHGVSVQLRRSSDMPPDWEKTRLTVAFLSNPENDMLAIRILEQSWGHEETIKARREAELAMVSINNWAMHLTQIDVADVLQALVDSKTSPESLDIVEKVVKGLPANAGMDELTLRLSDYDLRLKPEGMTGLYIGTIHSAKGREWDAVYLPGWSQENFPGKALEELRRLAFVAITRARHRVWISWPMQRMTWKSKETEGAGLIQQYNPSQFIVEMGLVTGGVE
jgi:DNA helicase-2/ATP-dependent DNA helicase PcrA